MPFYHERSEWYRLVTGKKILFFLCSSRLVSSQFHGSSHKVNASLTLGSTPILCWWLFRLLLITAASISSAAWVVLARYLFIIHTHDIFHDFLQSFVHLIDTRWILCTVVDFRSSFVNRIPISLCLLWYFAYIPGLVAPVIRAVPWSLFRAAEHGNFEICDQSIGTGVYIN